MGSTRTTVTLSEQEKHWLERYSRITGISIAEAIRRGVRGLMERERSRAYRVVLQSTRGIWIKGDGLQYQERLRAEWVDRDA